MSRPGAYWWARWGIARVNSREHLPAVFYLHPWEIDPGQPRLRAGRLSKFRHYRNLDKTEERLRQLLRDFRFGTMASLLADWATALPTETSSALPLPYLW